MLLVSKKKTEGNHAFSEIINLQFAKKCHTMLCISALFSIIWLNYLQKLRGYPEFSFLIPIALAIKDLLFSHSYKLRKITSVLVGTVLNFHDNSASLAGQLCSRHRSRHALQTFGFTRTAVHVDRKSVGGK